MATEELNVSSGEIIFGFDRATDERSLILFMQRLSNSELTDVLISRMDDIEINSILDLFTGLMKKHMSKDEYHHLFLGKGSR